MNHFFLWVGAPSTSEDAGRRLLGRFKAVGALSEIRGDNWSLISAPQRDGSGALEDKRVRQSTDPWSRIVAWFGHAWSASGPQPALESVDAADLSPDEMIKRLRAASDGVYALICGDPRTCEFAVASDCLGTFHIYFRRFEDGIAVSNSSALLAAVEPAAALDPQGVQEFCSSAVANEDRTLWQGVHKLRGGQILNVSERGRRIALLSQRPLLQAMRQADTPLEKAVPALYATMSKTIELLSRHGGRGPSFRHLPWAADLTGGNDSRALMAVLLSKRTPVVATVSGAPDHEDVVIGTRLALRAGLRHILRPAAGPLQADALFDALQLTDGEFDAIEFAAVAHVHRMHRNDGLQFSINGSYGETGRGYPWRLGPKGAFFPDRMAKALTSRAPVDAREQGQRRFKPAVPPDLFASSLRLDWSNHGAAMIQRLLEYAEGLPQCAQLDLVHVDLRMERWQGRIASSTNQLWPAVSPWGFRDSLRQLLTTSPLARRNSLLTRAFTAAYSPVLADELLFTGNPARPFTWSQAWKFLPAIGWYGKRARQKAAARFAPPSKDSLPCARRRQPHLCEHAEIRQWLSEPALAETNLFNRDALVAALDPQSGLDESAYTLWRRLVTLELALRRQKAA
jgi:hypothetical protein